MHYANHIVFTTIYYPKLLWEYQRNLEQWGHLDDTCVWVIGDRKTPPSVANLCQEVTQRGLKTTYLNCEDQVEWGKRHEPFFSLMPWNDDSRRNLGYLHALEEGCERILSIDDDNWPTGDDFIGKHSLVGKPWTGELVREKSGFHNVCEYLAFEPSRSIFPRGFPFRLRNQKNDPQICTAEKQVTIGVNAGLWLNEPDVDATTWLNGRIIGKRYHGPTTMVLNPGTWSPVNTQNTSVVRELIPAYLCISMGWDVPGGQIKRYGDIWGGYFLQAVLSGTPFVVAFGRPLVDHRRNPHDYVDDLRQEFWGMILTDWLLEELRANFSPTAVAICDRMCELSEFLLSRAPVTVPVWCPPEMKEFLKHTGRVLSCWAEMCRKVM